MSKLIMYDFECMACFHTFEDLCPMDTDYVSCPMCDYLAHKQISPVRIDHSAMALSPSASPSSIKHFDRIHRQRKAIETKIKREHGDYGNHYRGT